MEEKDEQQQGTMIPFWLQETAIKQSSDWSSIVCNLTSLLIPILILGMWIKFYIIPKIIYLMHQICNSKSLKRDLESLNMLLVLFAVICGLLTKISEKPDNPNHQTPSYMRRLSTHQSRRPEEDQIPWSRPETPSPANTATATVHAESNPARNILDVEDEIYYDAETSQDFYDEVRPAVYPTRSPPPPPHETQRQWVTSTMPPPPSPYALLWAPSAPPLPPPSPYAGLGGPSTPHITTPPPSAASGDMICRKRVAFTERFTSAIRNWIAYVGKMTRIG